MSDRKYYISFNTKELPGAIKAVSVALNNEIIVDKSYKMPVNLCEDPLYPLLVKYVKANPYRDK